LEILREFALGAELLAWELRFRFARDDYFLRFRLAGEDKAAKQHAEKSPRHKSS